MAEATGGGQRLLNATAVMASGTMVSRVLGFVRTMMIAFVLGNGSVRVEVFTFAMTVPNSLYMLLAGGTLNNVLVPQIVRAVVHDQDKGKAFIDRIMTAFLLALGVLTVLLTVAVPCVMSLYTTDIWRSTAMAEHWQTLLLMSYITMPQLFFYGVFFLLGQVLNARNVFGPMMWAPIANNVVSIGVFGAYIAVWGTNAAKGATFTTQQILLLGIGSTLGILIQTLVLLPYLKKAGISYRPRFDLKGTGLGRTFNVAKWMIGYVALTSLAQIVVSRLASTAAPSGAAGGGGFAAYQNAYLIWILPHSLLTVSLATAMLPAASRAAVAGDRAGVTTEVSRAARLASTFLVPGSLGLLALANPITSLIWGHGSGEADYHFVAWALMAFALGLVPYTIQYLYLRAFYALDDTKTPFLLQIGISGANALLAVAFVLPFDDPSTVAARLAGSYALSYLLGVWLTHRALARRIPDLPGRQTLQHLARLGLASLPAIGLAWLVAWAVGRLGGTLFTLLGLVLAIAVAVAVFFFAARRLGIPEAAELLGVLRRGKGSAADPALAAEEVMEAPGLIEELLTDPASAAPWTEFAPSAGEQSSAAPAPDASPTTPADSSPELAAPAEEINANPDGEGVFVPVVAPQPPESLLEFPEPGEQESDDEPTNLVDVGRMLAGRYQLAELLASRDGQRTWRAEDTVLARNVLIHVLAEGDPRSEQVLALARRAALATDSRFLRVLDVVEAVNGEHGVYIVYEYAPGQTLQRVLEDGPLTGAETAWIVREVSDALTLLHADGLYHRHISPATVLITSSGNVKIIGLLVDEALTDLPITPDDGQAADVEALGKLLYACLVARWPDGARYGLAAAPVTDGRLALPSQVRSGVAHPVDVVVDRILSPLPRQGASRLATAADITTELSLVLGPSSAAADLRLRLGHPGTGSLPAVSVVAPPVPTPASPRFEVSQQVPDEFSGEVPEGYVPPEHTPPPFTPVPPPASADSPPPPDRVWPPRITPARVLLGLAIIAVAIGLLVYLAGNRSQPAAVPAPTSSSPAATTPAVPLAVLQVRDFDPKKDGGSGQENRKQVGLAVDNDPATAWTTERYKTKPTFGGLKPGVGLVLDFGKSVSARSVWLTLGEGATSLEVRVPAADLAAAKPPMSSEKQWRTVASLPHATGSFGLEFEPVDTRYLLLYITELPAVDDTHYQAAIVDLQARS
ncbi:MAG: murein biosynthesis integral membrane protein MurJ [Propionicimonas sp.]|nr:murein biosynthesis integral membrane protein MurJ [Propionicimonas sp.]